MHGYGATMHVVTRFAIPAGVLASIVDTGGDAFHDI